MEIHAYLRNLRVVSLLTTNADRAIPRLARRNIDVHHWLMARASGRRFDWTSCTLPRLYISTRIACAKSIRPLDPPTPVMTPSLSEMIAPPLLVITISMLMVGIMLSQVSYYASNYRHDPCWMKYIVYTVCLVEVAHACTLLHMQYFYVLEAAQNQLPKIAWSSAVSIILGVVTTCLVQGLYIYRIWQFGHDRCLTSLLAVLVFCRFALGIAMVAFTIVYDEIAVLLNNRAAIITVNSALSVSVVIDTLSPAVFIYSLRLHQSQVKQTQTVLRKLTFYTVNTGAIAIIFSATTLATFNLDKRDLLFAGFVSALGQIYANTMMALLNARQRLRDEQSGLRSSIPMEFGRTVPPNFVIGISHGIDISSSLHDPTSGYKTETPDNGPHYTLI